MPQRHQRKQTKKTHVNLVNITVAFTTFICNVEQMGTPSCPTSRAITEMRCFGPYHEPVAFNSAPSKAADPPAGQLQRGLLR